MDNKEILKRIENNLLYIQNYENGDENGVNDITDKMIKKFTARKTLTMKDASILSECINKMDALQLYGYGDVVFEILSDIRALNGLEE